MLTFTFPKLRPFVLLLVAALALLSACGGKGREEGDSPSATAGIRMKVAHTLTPETHCHKGLIRFKELVEAKAPGRIDVQLYHSGQLGDSAELLERLKSNSVQMCLTANAPLSNFESKLKLVDLPFLFPDARTAERLLDGPIGEEMVKDLPQKAGLRVLAFWVSGFRSIYSTKRIYRQPADLSGTNIRVMETPVHIAVFNALGANARPMPFSELYTALQQGNVDAAENDADAFYSGKFYEVCKYFTLTNHVYTAIPLSISERFWQSLPDDVKVVITEAAREARDYERALAAELNQAALDKLRAAGVEVAAVDPQPFAEIARKVYPRFENEIGADLLARALAEVQSAP
ncbi:TRAP transporter substrate-binding protein [bacterium]|nr:TRAP transporter substrate-binding protein [bacterium]